MEKVIQKRIEQIIKLDSSIVYEQEKKVKVKPSLLFEEYRKALSFLSSSAVLRSESIGTNYLRLGQYNDKFCIIKDLFFSLLKGV
jgi:hypothetical protein